MSERNEELVLAIDLGTSGPKVALVTLDGDVLACEFEPTTLNLLPNGGAEQCPEDWWSAIKSAAGRLLAPFRSAGDGALSRLVAVSCTTQWSGTVAVDRSGQPLMDAIIWMDSRGADHIRSLVRGRVSLEGYDPLKLLTWLRLTGGVPTLSGKDSIAHILFLKHERPEIYRETYKFLEPKDYLNLRLTGRYAASYDSICLHWVTDNRHIDRVVYHPRLLKMAGLDREKLPDLRRAFDVLGPLDPAAAADLGLPPGLPVVVGAPDIHSAAIGSGAVLDYQAHLYIGTSSWLSCHLPFKKTDLFHNMAALPSALPGSYLLIDEQECAGICLTYLRDSLVFPDDGLTGVKAPPDAYAVLDRLAAGVPAGSDKLIFTPWLYGERTPVDDHLVRGGFFNQTLSTTRAQLIRAVLEGVAYNTRWLLVYVEKFIRRPLEGIHLVGGGAKSGLWCQIFADVLNRPIHQVEDPIQVNVRGAAFLAALALGRLTRDEIAGRTRIACTYHPDPANREIYDELFREFTNLYRLIRPVYARLNRSGN